MCCTTVLGFIVGVVLFRVFRRYRAWRYGYGEGGCGGGFGGPFGHRHSGCGGHGHGFHRANYAGYGWRAGSAFDGASGRGFAGSASDDGAVNARSDGASNIPPSGRALDDLVRSLELNQRQKTEAEPVFALIKQRLGVVGPKVDSALHVIAADRFDPAPLAAQLANLPEPLQRELLDGLEHLHTILISEQREQLKRELLRR